MSKFNTYRPLTENERKTTVTDERLRHTQRQLFDSIGMITEGMEDLVISMHQASLRKDAVLILGETGTEKEMVARGIAQLKTQNGQQRYFYKRNVAEFSPERIESELFGHTEGAFTGAESEQNGILQIANGGILFLDEVDELPTYLQAKLLTVLEDGVVQKVGAEKSDHVDIQYIAATSSVPDSDGKSTLRPDFLERLSANVIYLQPFRNRSRKARIALVNNAFNTAPKQSERARDGTIVLPDSNVIEALADLNFPNNIRQMINTVMNVYANAEYNYINESVLPDTISVHMSHLEQVNLRDRSLEISTDTIEPLDRIKYQYVERALGMFNGNRTKTAKALQICVRQLQRMIKDGKVQG